MTALLAMLALGQNLPIDQWQPFENGFAAARQDSQLGPVIHVHPRGADQPTGAVETITLNQASARPVVFSSFSRSQSVSLPTDDGYSIYIDTTYSDGTYLYGTTSDFGAGTHDWQKRQVMVWPQKPIRSVSIYLLLRGHSGEAWFAKPTFRELNSGEGFDGQALKPPTLALHHRSGWFIRPFQVGGLPDTLVPLAQADRLGVKSTATGANSENSVSIATTQRSGLPATVYFCVRCNLDHPRWWPTMRRSEPVAAYESAAYHAVNAGAIGQMSLYPYAAVTNDKRGLMIAVPPSQGPAVYRLFYDSDSKLLCAAFDFYVTSKPAVARVYESACDPGWGLRDAVERYAHRYPEVAVKRVRKEGIWIPFTDPSTIPHPDDFGFAFHEGDNSVSRDAKLGIASFRYSEPMTWWMAMDPAIPRTYEKAIEVAKADLQSSATENKANAQSLFNSGTMDENGNFNVQFENEPWTNGAVWVLNPNPTLVGGGVMLGKTTKANVVYGRADADRRYGPGSQLSGEYLDSLESRADTRDYSPASLAASPYPPSFAPDSHRPFIPEWFSTFELTKYMSDDLHRRGKLLFANTIAWSKQCLVPPVDLGGTETNWQDNGKYVPEPDDIMCYRRALSLTKPYLLLMNSDFSTWTHAWTEKYFQRAMAYGIFPSFFSANAATRVYWENPALYERDRSLFKRYIPVIRRLDAAGWEPVTRARTSDPRCYVERFGRHFWTVFNPTSAPIQTRFQMSAPGHGLRDALTGERLPLDGALTVGPEQCRVLVLGP